jgi:hypothetical protein
MRTTSNLPNGTEWRRFEILASRPDNFYRYGLAALAAVAALLLRKLLMRFLVFPFTSYNFCCKTRRSPQSGNVQIPEDKKGTGYPVSSAHPTSAVVEPETFS